MKPYSFVVERTNTGYSGFCEEYAVYTAAEDLMSLRENAVEALELYFSDEPRVIKPQQIGLQLELTQLFAFYSVINSSAFARRIGMNESLLAQYVLGLKLPSEKQTRRIVQGLRDLGAELLKLDVTP
ncbi:MAG: XRE family transcriptional regulator [Candidatus Kapabacteria bacterium]|nr:XRE family transcriptional regulator [Candidatus Kapabacteria bacterium]